LFNPPALPAAGVPGDDAPATPLDLVPGFEELTVAVAAFELVALLVAELASDGPAEANHTTGAAATAMAPPRASAALRVLCAFCPAFPRVLLARAMPIAILSWSLSSPYSASVTPVTRVVAGAYGLALVMTSSRQFGWTEF
jgi:hypothetical protein